MRGFGKRTAEVERGPKCRPHLAVTRSPPVRRRNVRRDREQVYEPSLTDTGRGPLPDRGAGCTSFDPHSRSLPSRGSPADGAPDRVGEVASALVGVVRLPGDARRGLGAGAAPVTANRGVRSGARGRPRCIRPAMHPVPGCVGSAELLLAPRSPYARDAPRSRLAARAQALFSPQAASSVSVCGAARRRCSANQSDKSSAPFHGARRLARQSSSTAPLAANQSSRSPRRSYRADSWSAPKPGPSSPPGSEPRVSLRSRRVSNRTRQMAQRRTPAIIVT